MFEHFGVNYETVLPGALSRERVESFDELVISGGGNMGGDYYAIPYRARQRIIGFDLPVTVFPQSFVQNREDLSPYKKIYVREKASHALNRYFDLAPDMALGYSGPIPQVKPACTAGVFLRDDVEQLFQGHELSLGDPAWLSQTVEELFDLACRFEHIVTDRLHFCYCWITGGPGGHAAAQLLFQEPVFLSNMAEKHLPLAGRPVRFCV